MVPSAFVALDELPLTASGKVDRGRLPEPAAERPDLDIAYTPPTGPLEQELASAVFCDLLGLERVGAHDSFFELGGNSLLGLQVVARVRERCGVELDVRRFYQSPTVVSLAALVASLRGDASASSPPARPDEPTDDELDRVLEGR